MTFTTGTCKYSRPGSKLISDGLASISTSESKEEKGMKHVSMISRERVWPMAATDLLVKERQIQVIGEALDVLGAALALVEDTLGKGGGS